MNEWLTAREIAAEQLPDMPATESAVIRLAGRNGWDGTSKARKRQGRGGATEYHFSLLPTLAQVTYQQKHMVVERPAAPATAGVSNDFLTGIAVGAGLVLLGVIVGKWSRRS